MSENLSTGLLFKDALLNYSEKYKDDNDICGVKIDMRPQGIDLIVGIRFIENESQFTVCTGGTNCEGADDSHFDLLSEALTNIGVASKSGAAIMIKRNAQVVSTEEGCSAIETVEEAAATSVETQKKRGGLFGLFGK
ncbi:MAG: hypothetical protein ABFR02_08965 [Campylobacterota bacterium]